MIAPRDIRLVSNKEAHELTIAPALPSPAFGLLTGFVTAKLLNYIPEYILYDNKEKYASIVVCYAELLKSDISACLNDMLILSQISTQMSHEILKESSSFAETYLSILTDTLSGSSGASEGGPCPIRQNPEERKEMQNTT